MAEEVELQSILQNKTKTQLASLLYELLNDFLSFLRNDKLESLSRTFFMKEFNFEQPRISSFIYKCSWMQCGSAEARSYDLYFVHVWNWSSTLNMNERITIPVCMLVNGQLAKHCEFHKRYFCSEHVAPCYFIMLTVRAQSVLTTIIGDSLHFMSSSRRWWWWWLN